MEFRICSYARPDTNIANELINGVFPLAAKPAAMPAMFASAMPQLICLSGKASANLFVFVAAARSASKTTIFSSSFPSSTKVFPYPSLVAIFGSSSNFLFIGITFPPLFLNLPLQLHIPLFSGLFHAIPLRLP